MGVSPSTVSRLKEEDIPKFSALLAEIGLQVVPVSSRVYDQQLIDALKVLARCYLELDKSVGIGAIHGKIFNEP